MARTRGLGWLARGALLASALVVPACTDSGTGAKNGGTTAALWNTTSGGASVGPAPGVLLWNDPNTGPINGGTGGGGNLTYGQADPTDYGSGPPPPGGSKWMNSALSTATPQNATTGADEQTIEGLALAYHSSLTNLGGAAGVAGIGGVGGVAGVGGFNQQPPLYSSSNMELEPRGYCEAILAPAGAVTFGPGAFNTAGGLAWRLGKCGINLAMQNPTEYPVRSGAATTATQAWNAMATAGAQARIQGITTSAYCGAGSWTMGGATEWDLTFIDLPLGQTP
jgi:hypothetical protein